MPAYIVAQVKINDKATYDAYKKLTPTTVAMYGGRFLARGGTVTPLEGAWMPERLVIVEFPSVEKARAWWDSSEYAAAKTLRQSCSETEMLVTEGV